MCLFFLILHDAQFLFMHQWLLLILECYYCKCLLLWLYFILFLLLLFPCLLCLCPKYLLCYLYHWKNILLLLLCRCNTGMCLLVHFLLLFLCLLCYCPIYLLCYQCLWQNILLLLCPCNTFSCLLIYHFYLILLRLLLLLCCCFRDCPIPNQFLRYDETCSKLSSLWPQYFWGIVSYSVWTISFVTNYLVPSFQFLYFIVTKCREFLYNKLIQIC